jgi:hypothetical protein
MVFCKLSKDLKNKLESSEKSLQNSIKTAQKVVNKHIENNLKAIEQKKNSFSALISKKIEEKKKAIEATIIKPYIEKKKKNYAVMFIVDICLSAVCILFLYKMYPFIKHYITKENYTPEQYEKAKQLPETAYTKDELRTVKEFRQSYQSWIDYYKQDNAFSDDNLGLNEIRRGSALRQPFLFIIQYVIPYIILAYVVWFIIKYIKYVLAAIWGFFVAIYQFVTLKITCKLAEKWYIRLVTGWSRCNPNWSEYVDNWKNTYISRPLAEERIGYLRGVQDVKTAYNSKYGTSPPWKLGLGFFTFDWFSSFWDWFRNLKKIYIDLPLQELYLQIIDFHPSYVVYPYEIITSEGDKKMNKLAGNAYPSKTKKGKICKCPPKKTVFKKLNNFIQKAPSTAQMKSTVSNVNKSIQNLKTSTAASFTKGISKLPSISNAVPTCSTIEKNTKRAAQGLWTSMMLFTTGIVVYSLLYSTPSFISNLVSPVYNFANSYTPTASIPISGIIILSTYFTVFTGLGYYSFIR